MPLTTTATTRRAPVTLVIDAVHPTGHVGLGPALRTHGALGCHPTTVVTAIRPLTPLPGRLVRDQLARALVVAPDAIGVGDPGDQPEGLIEALLDARGPDRRAADRPLIVAPNAVDRRRAPRFDPAHLKTMARELMPHAEAVVLDGDEAALLTGRPCPDLGRLREAARRLHDFGPRWVVVTGGRTQGHAVDLVYDGSDFTEFGSSRRAVDDQAGAGIVFAHLLIGWRARGLRLLDAVDQAKRGVGGALAHATRVGRAARVEPLGAALRALGLDPRPIAVPDPDANPSAG